MQLQPLQTSGSTPDLRGLVGDHHLWALPAAAAAHTLARSQGLVRTHPEDDAVKVLQPGELSHMESLSPKYRLPAASDII